MSVLWSIDCLKCLPYKLNKTKQSRNPSMHHKQLKMEKLNLGEIKTKWSRRKKAINSTKSRQRTKLQ